MHVDFKITGWGRFEVPDGYEEQAKEILKKNPNISSEEFFSELSEISKPSDITWKTLDNVETDMSLDDNDGYATIEAFDSIGEAEPCWKNGK